MNINSNADNYVLETTMRFNIKSKIRTAFLPHCLTALLPYCLTAFAACSLSPVPLNAQALIMLLLGDKIASENFVGGVVGGVTMTTMTGNDSARVIVNWSFGALLQWKLSDEWMFTPEVVFKMPAGSNGMNGLYSDQPGLDTLVNERTESTSTSYVSIPLIFKYTFPEFGIFAGPQVGYLVAATDNLQGVTSTGLTVEMERLAFYRLNRWDLGICAGLDYALNPQFGIHSLRFGLRYYQGLLDVTADDDVTVLNSGFMFTVGVPIGGVPKE